MKASLEFNLDDMDDEMSHFRCIRALDMALVLHDFDEKLRSMARYAESDRILNLAVNGQDVHIPAGALEAVRALFHDVMESRGINMEELIR
jgi:hypothetical protein